ncbi:hypothetical protein BB560_006652 [Smittium megazygosporum]|uniref:UDP-N-acetylglucosamine transferase subunit ALG13 n=1 Tax=Smittium megazygosporum TaxID=133381 RepID=A0A2T9Y2M5_9FUNG|nr:hypothetical protein BB560_006652 [Smittium megazygosporum]
MKAVFVTVGSTGFDQLVSVVCSTEFINTLHLDGFGKIVVQYGQSEAFFHPPPNLDPSILISGFSYKKDLSQYYEDADLVISHAGT